MWNILLCSWFFIFRFSVLRFIFKKVGQFGNSLEFCTDEEEGGRNNGCGERGRGQSLLKRNETNGYEMLFDDMRFSRGDWEHGAFSVCRASLPKGWLEALAFNTALSSCTTQQQFKWEPNPNRQLPFIPRLITCRVTVCLLKFSPKKSCLQALQGNKLKTGFFFFIFTMLERWNYENGPEEEKSGVLTLQ